MIISNSPNETLSIKEYICVNGCAIPVISPVCSQMELLFADHRAADLPVLRFPREWSGIHAASRRAYRSTLLGKAQFNLEAPLSLWESLLISTCKLHNHPENRKDSKDY